MLRRFTSTRVRLAQPNPETGLVERRRRGPIRPSLRWAVLERDGFTCQYCGRRAPDVELVVDHIIPVVAGGTDSQDNLVASCADCNAGKGPALPVAVRVAVRANSGAEKAG